MAVANVPIVRPVAPMPTEQISKPRSIMTRSPQLSGRLVRSSTCPCRAGHARLSTVAAPCRSRMPARGVRHTGYRLLPFAVLDHLLDLLLHRIEIEGSRVLHRRIVNRRQRQFLDILLDHDEAPELTGEEVVHVAGGAD